MNRRQLLHRIGAAGTTLLAHSAEPPFEIWIAPVSPHAFRLTLFPIRNGALAPVPDDGTLVQSSWGPPVAKLRGATRPQAIRCGDLRIQFAPPLSFTVHDARGAAIQHLDIDAQTGAVSFTTGTAPLLALGEGGPQFDRRGSTDRMRSGQGGYQLRTHGGRVPVPWLIGTGGWAMFVHQPIGAFDFSGPESKFLPAAPLPLDLFFVASPDPATIMAEYARLTGHPELPPLWSFGYLQSHRTLASHEEILQEAKTFREKKLPCDAFIYLGTGFCPSGWNTNNTEFDFNRKVFPDPKAIFGQLHQDHLKVVLHVAYPTRIPEMRGAVKDPCDAAQRAEIQPSCYWDMHRPVFSLGVDGWWPDEGDALDLPSRLVRNRMYWEGPQLDRPGERPFALHRNGAAGMQRYGSFLWSGDVNSEWETLRAHVPVGINTGLTGIPFWGTDIGGFIPTKELTGELYVRWFQFGAFCPLFRSHGRTWKLRLPWGWNTGDPGPVETNFTPDPAALHDARVEPICRKYLELRYRLLPYLYSAVRECASTGMPVMRALWLHYPGDPAAVACGDQYLWGRDILVAPVVEPGAASRKVYLPPGAWFDFWTGERLAGGREIIRPVDLETMPLYVRAGAILPLGPVRQFADEPVDEPLAITIYPGAGASFLLYEDDGRSFQYRKGEWMGIRMAWNDARRVLSLRLAPGSRMLPPLRRSLSVNLGKTAQSGEFEGRPLELRF
ncbi:MAG TPA: TIM-barrel domain-containing protein [Bryobacteraceae bacterium]|nr:TIM-barrel domain-containing protein [Bryobacteraceae bacterium]